VTPQLTPEGLLRREYGNSKNFITPTIVEAGWIVTGRIAYELSTGEGLERGTELFGVSIVRKKENSPTRTARMFHHSKCFHSQSEAMNYIDKLKRDLTGVWKEEDLQ
jgi:hypothetical protein